MNTLSKVTVAAALLCASPALAEVSVELTYTPAGTFTMLKLAEPVGTACFLKNDAETSPKAVTAPFALPVQPMMYYQFTCTLPTGHVWTKKIEAKLNHLGEIKLTASGPATLGDVTGGAAAAQAAGATALGAGMNAAVAAQIAAANALPSPAVTPTITQVTAAHIAAANAMGAQAGAMAAQAGAAAHLAGTAAEGVEIDEPEPERTSMTDAAFSALRTQVRAASFSSDKIGAIRAAAEANLFTVAQVGELVDLATHSSDKVKIVRVLRSKIVDPESAFQLQSKFTFSSDKKKVADLFR